MEGGRGSPHTYYVLLDKGSPDPTAPCEAGISTHTSKMRRLRIREEAELGLFTHPLESLARQRGSQDVTDSLHTDFMILPSENPSHTASKWQTWAQTLGPDSWSHAHGGRGRCLFSGDLVESGRTDWRDSQHLSSLIASFVAVGATPGRELQEKGNNLCSVDSLCLDLLVPVPPHPTEPRR